MATPAVSKDDSDEDLDSDADEDDMNQRRRLQENVRRKGTLSAYGKAGKDKKEAEKKSRATISKSSSRTTTP